MADELKAIQAELDSLLDRLSAHLEHDAEPSPGREDAARVVLHYAREGRSLEASVCTARDVARGRWQGPKITPTSRLGELADSDHPEGLAPLVEAMCAIWEWQWHRFPLEDKHAAAMARAVDAWSSKQCQFIGENLGLELTPKRCGGVRQVDPRGAVREMAAHDARSRHQHDPTENPTGTGLFERVGEHYALSEGATRRAYYADEIKELWKEIERIEAGFRRDDKT